MLRWSNLRYSTVCNCQVYRPLSKESGKIIQFAIQGMLDQLEIDLFISFSGKNLPDEAYFSLSLRMIPFQLDQAFLATFMQAHILFLRREAVIAFIEKFNPS